MPTPHRDLTAQDRAVYFAWLRQMAAGYGVVIVLGIAVLALQAAPRIDVALATAGPAIAAAP